MVRMPIVDQSYLDGDQQPAVETVAPQGDSGGSSSPNNPIGPVQGYPEDGKHAWRAGNDDVIVAAVKKYNTDNGYSPGDAAYMTPQLMKSWMMRESGGSPAAFRTDPFQVNNGGDWDPAKAKVAGLSPGQTMTPQDSADAALKWLQYKGQINNQGRLVPYQGHYEALRKYNAAPLNNLPRGVDYATDVVNRARASYGYRQQ